MALLSDKSRAAKLLGSMTSDKKAASSRINGLRGGYWRQKRNNHKSPSGLNAKYVQLLDVDKSQ